MGLQEPGARAAIRELVYEIRPADLYVSISSEVAPRIGEYERTVATVINSYVGPRSSRYLQELEAQLRANGMAAPASIMQSNGGVAPLASAASNPVKTIGSGPVGGLGLERPPSPPAWGTATSSPPTWAAPPSRWAFSSTAARC